MSVIDIDYANDKESTVRFIIEISRYVFLLIYHIEAYIKIKALNTNYFKDYWNVFDILIILVSDIILILVLTKINIPI